MVLLSGVVVSRRGGFCVLSCKVCLRGWRSWCLANCAVSWNFLSFLYDVYKRFVCDIFLLAGLMYTMLLGIRFFRNESAQLESG